MSSRVGPVYAASVELVYERVVSGVAEELALARVESFLGERGYQPVTGVPCAYVRGRRLAGLTTFDMARLFTRVEVSARPASDGAELSLRFMVDTFGQWISETNRRFWELETEDLFDAAHGRSCSAGRLESYRSEARRDTLRFVVTSMLLSVICFMLVWAIGRASW